MLELSMAASRYDQSPAIRLKHFQHIANSHALTEYRFFDGTNATSLELSKALGSGPQICFNFGCFSLYRLNDFRLKQRQTLQNLSSV